MSISNLLSSNSLDLQAGSLTATTINATNIQKGGQGVTYNNFDFVQSNSGALSLSIPLPADTEDVTTFQVADTLFSTTGGTYSMPLDTTYNVVVKATVSMYNSNASGTRAGAIGFMFQNADDSWNTSPANLPYVWNILELKEGGSLTLCHKLSAGHGFKAVRLMVGAEGTTDVKFGGGSITRANYAIIETHSSL